MRIVKNGDVHVSAPIGMPREKVIAFIEEHKDWIEQARKKTYERQKQRAEFYNKLPLTTRAQADEALKRLKALVEPMMEKHAKEMGVKPSIVYYKPTISRWGQCNVKDRSICISAYVLLLPEWRLAKRLTGFAGWKRMKKNKNKEQHRNGCCSLLFSPIKAIRILVSSPCNIYLALPCTYHPVCG